MKSRLIHLGLAIAAMLAVPVAASAADLGPAPSYKAPAYVAPSYATWSGFYVGINGGYGFGKADGGGANVDVNGFLVGGTVGYNLQTGVWVWGIEGDFDYSAMKDSTGGVDTKVPWFATVRGRIGYAGWGNLMPYITGGAAFAKMEVDAGAAGSDNDTKVGWTLGAGLEYAMFSNWSVKIEYLYADLGTYSIGGADIDYTTNIVRAGINYRF
ncbi:MAG TPA: outer membrane protein [Pseudolabrys sp.]|jgi:outer membrane immunogenic protein|nr:outer membrane protein [Pseudolabrys sp.]